MTRNGKDQNDPVRYQNRKNLWITGPEADSETAPLPITQTSARPASLSQRSRVRFHASAICRMG